MLEFEIKYEGSGASSDQIRPVNWELLKMGIKRKVKVNGAGFWAIVWQGESNLACEFGSPRPEKRELVYFMV